MKREVREILDENERRQGVINAPFDPISGMGSTGKRVEISLPDFYMPRMWVPEGMVENGLVARCLEAGSIRGLVMRLLAERAAERGGPGADPGGEGQPKTAAGSQGQGRPRGVAAADAAAATGAGNVDPGMDPVGQDDGGYWGGSWDEGWRESWDGEPNVAPGVTEEQVEREMAKVRSRILRVRIKCDFPFWAALLVNIKKKGGGQDVKFVLNRPQRKLVERLEEMRLAEMPIRLILLKARQWGGSTCIQMYMAWLQLVHDVGLNSLIIGHVGSTSTEVEDMFKRMLAEYPAELLHEDGEEWEEDEDKWVGVGQAQNIHRVPQRNCKIKLGTAERPDSARGGDYNLVHLTEVGLWKKTEGKTPEDVVQGATDGILLKAMTMIVMESTAKGVGNFFNTEYVDAKRGISQFTNFFISWMDIDQYSMEFDPGRVVIGREDPVDRMSREEFAEWLWMNRKNDVAPDQRHEAGTYLWWLWELGATLEAINWYVHERAGKSDSARMRSEYPSDDIEAFVNSGANVFDKVQVDRMRRTTRPAKWVGELEGKVPLGGEGYTDGVMMTRRGVGSKALLEDLHFVRDSQGGLHVWAEPEVDDEDEVVTNRYVVVVDVGGRGEKADWSVICVIDRFGLIVDGKPSVVAQWTGHIDMDLLAWKAAQIAKWYNEALLVIESNTLETRDRDHIVDGQQMDFILLQIKDAYRNLYARKQSEEDIKVGAPTRYGFHTNTATKPMVISTLIKMVREGAWVERDDVTLDELCFYERKPNNSYGAITGKHDDRLMTRAIGLHVCMYEMEWPEVRKRVRRLTSRVRVVERVPR